MKTKKLSHNKYRLISGALTADVTLTSRDGYYYYRTGGVRKAAKTRDRAEALKIAATAIFGEVDVATDKPRSKPHKGGVTLQDLADRLWAAYESGALEGPSGSPLSRDYVKRITLCARRIAGKELSETALSEFAQSAQGTPAPVARYRRELFSDANGKPLRVGAEYQSRGSNYNHNIRCFKSLLKPEYLNSLYGDLDLDRVAVDAIRGLRKKKVESKGFKAFDSKTIKKLDDFFRNKDNFRGGPEAKRNVWLRYWLARCCGLRRTEILQARQGWIRQTDAGPVLQVDHTTRWHVTGTTFAAWSPKSRQSRTIPIPQWLADEIVSSRQSDSPDEPVLAFTGFDQERSYFEKQWKRHWRLGLETIGEDWKDYPKTTHQLRGEFITAVCHQTGGVTTAQAYAGHADPQTTAKHYYDPTKVGGRVEINPIGQSLS